MQIPGSSDSSEATATILWGNGGELTGNVTMIPATLGGYKVTVLGNGAQNITANNKNEDTYVLIPDGVTTLSARMIYDYNTTSGWSIPSSVTSIDDPAFIEDSLTWWFTDKSKTPGYSGGNKFAVIYAENSSTPITVEATQLKNKNYEDYGDSSSLSKGQTAADNLLVSVEGSGAANITFTDENSSTKWDKTGKEDGTCEMNGDFYIGEYSSNESGSPDIGTGANSLTAAFINSEWEGIILYGDDTGKADLTFDSDSTWTVTSDTSVNHIEVEDINSIKSDKKVTITYAESDSITPGTYGNVTFVQAK